MLSLERPACNSDSRGFPPFPKGQQRLSMTKLCVQTAQFMLEPASFGESGVWVPYQAGVLTWAALDEDPGFLAGNTSHVEERACCVWLLGEDGWKRVPGLLPTSPPMPFPLPTVLCIPDCNKSQPWPWPHAKSLEKCWNEAVWGSSKWTQTKWYHLF